MTIIIIFLKLISISIITEILIVAKRSIYEKNEDEKDNDQNIIDEKIKKSQEKENSIKYKISEKIKKRY